HVVTAERALGQGAPSYGPFIALPRPQGVSIPGHSRSLDAAMWPADRSSVVAVASTAHWRRGRRVAEAQSATEVATYCPLCVSRCGSRATVTNGTFTLDRDPSHPTGKALCIKG